MKRTIFEAAIIVLASPALAMIYLLGLFFEWRQPPAGEAGFLATMCAITSDVVSGHTPIRDDDPVVINSRRRYGRSFI